MKYPGHELVDWYGFTRHNFELEGRSGFIVEPKKAAPGLPWSWCLQWAEEFVPRTPALKLLERGCHHVHFNIFDTYASEDGIRKLNAFYQMLQNMGFAHQAFLTGMSYGGLFSLRWAAEHPETVHSIYLDAPVCDLGFRAIRTAEDTDPKDLPGYYAEADRAADAYHLKNRGELHDCPLSPLNNFRRIAEAGIPILAIRPGRDTSVPAEQNIDVFEKRFCEAGGNITILRQDNRGHHPHGLDDPSIIADFLEQPR